MLKLAAGLLRPTQGKIECSSAKLRLAYLSQSPILFDHLSIQQNARYLMELKHNKPYADNKKFLYLAEKLNIAGLLESNRHLRDLSGGERQRVVLLQAISINPDIIFLDEPCTGLDSSTKRDFLLSLTDLLSEINALAIYVSHHNDEVKLIADRLIYLSEDCSVLYDGAIDGESENIPNEVLQFLNHPFYNKLFAKQDKDGHFVEYSIDKKNDFQEIGLLGDHVEYSDSEGLEYKIMKSTKDLSIVKLNVSGGPTVVVKGYPSGPFINMTKAIVPLN